MLSAGASQPPVSRTVYLMGDVTEQSVSQTVQHLFFLTEQDHERPINLIISTYGGEVYALMALYDAMKFCPAPIHTIGIGKIMSAGCLVLAAGERGHRMIGANATLMSHNMSGGSFGDIFTHKVALEEFKRLEDVMIGLTAIECRRTPEEVSALYRPNGTDYKPEAYLNAQQALDFGFIDHILPGAQIQPPCADAKISKKRRKPQKKKATRRTKRGAK